MKKAFTIVLAFILSFCAVFPASAEQQITGETLTLTVKDETNRFIYQSYDGGKTWERGSKPLVYISIDNTIVSKNDGNVRFTVHNNTEKEIYYGRQFALQKWNGDKWVKNPKFDEMNFAFDAAILAPKSSQPDVAAWAWAGIKAGVGKYKLVKKITVDSRQFTCEAEFVIADGLPELTVKDETNRLIYKSNDGGKTWTGISNPPVHISIEKTVLPKSDGKISYTVHNNTQKEMWTDVYFSLQKWNGQKWVNCPETDDLMFQDIALQVTTEKPAALSAAWGKNKLATGKYKLITKEAVDNRKFTCEAVFFLETA